MKTRLRSVLMQTERQNSAHHVKNPYPYLHVRVNILPILTLIIEENALALALLANAEDLEEEEEGILIINLLDNVLDHEVTLDRILAAVVTEGDPLDIIITHPLKKNRIVAPHAYLVESEMPRKTLMCIHQA